MNFFPMTKRLTTTKRHNIAIILLALAVSAGIWIIALNNNNSKKKNHLSARVFKGVKGWGYDIMLDDSIFIHQEYIPVIAANKGFTKQEDATKVASLVLQKLQQNKLPTLTTFDLQQIISVDKINYDQ